MVAPDLLDDDGLLDLRPRARRTDAAAVIGEERARKAPVPAANQALREWSPPAEASPAGPAGPAAASQDAVCALCGTKPARSRCRACGRGTCAADLWSMLGVCKACVAGGNA